MCLVNSIFSELSFFFFPQGGASAKEATEDQGLEKKLVVGLTPRRGKRLFSGGKAETQKKPLNQELWLEDSLLKRDFTGIVRDQTRHQKPGFPSTLESLTGSEPNDQSLYRGNRHREVILPF